MESEKITDGVRHRTYDDACGAAHGLDLVGERWALLVMRELMYGPKRFGDIRASLPGISANTLTQRLESLEAAGILGRRKLPPPASVQVYELTEWGYESEPIFQTLGRWAARSPRHDPTLPLSAVSLMMSMRTMIDRGKAEGLAATLGFDIGPDTFRATLRGGELAIERGDGPADAILAGGAGAVGALLYGKVPLAALEAAGQLRVSGDRALVLRYAALFGLPPKASVGPA